MTWWLPESSVNDFDGIILDGSIRAGKTLPESVSFVDWAMYTYHDTNLGMAGKTLGALRRNVIGPLKQVLPGRGYKVRDYRSAEEPHLEISKGRKTNYFHLFGGNNEKSQDPVQGFTGGGFYFDEVALMPQSFVNQAEGRCSLDESKYWYNCNPEGPYHYFKLEYLEKLFEKNLLHLHFTMDDNLSLSLKTKERYERRYSKGSTFYRRFILGEWCMAEGRIYDFFTEDRLKGYVVDALPQSFDRYHIGIDFATSSVCVFLLIGRSQGIWYLIREIYWDAQKQGRQKTDSEYSRDFGGLVKDIRPRVDCDPGGGGAGLIAQLRKDYPGLLINSAMNEVIPGIQTTSQALTDGKLKIHSSCVNTIQQLSTYSWDPKAQERGEDKPVKKNDHAPDALRYAIMRIMRGTASVSSKPMGL